MAFKAVLFSILGVSVLGGGAVGVCYALSSKETENKVDKSAKISTDNQVVSQEERASASTPNNLGESGSTSAKLPASRPEVQKGPVSTTQDHASSGVNS